MPEITIAELAAATTGRVVGDGSVAVLDVTHDSRHAGPGVLFVAIPGARSDGHDFVQQALGAGSPAACVEEETALDGGNGIAVADTRSVLGPMAAVVHGDPSRQLRLVGVTGTNGKTTVTHLLESICIAAGVPEALVGTIGARIRGAARDMERTTPEASDFQRLLAVMVEAGVDVAAVEVSSHALAMGRVAATRFAIGAFTNLSQDHLDFHGDMQRYEAAKASLFEQVEHAVLWIDDPAGRRLAESISVPVTTIGTAAESDRRVEGVALTFAGSRFSLDGLTFRVPLAGRFNVANAAVAAACALELGIDPASIASGLETTTVVPGRFEIVDTPHPATIVVDYAHTPDGISAALNTVREIIGDSGRVVVVVGAGGDRDREKRPLMGEAATRADVAILTSDNPRTEDPDSILLEVAAGATGPAHVVIEVDRRSAIRTAVASAGAGDVVLILGKGHEPGQDFGHTVVPFDDRVVAREEAGGR